MPLNSGFKAATNSAYKSSNPLQLVIFLALPHTSVLTTEDKNINLEIYASEDQI